MVHRVQVSDVHALIETDLLDIVPHIDAANSLIDEKLVNVGLGDTRLKLIEAWLSAHFVAMREDSARLRRISQGETVAIFTDEVGTGLNATRFGQQAMLLDTSGVLNRLSKPTASISVIRAPDVT